MRLKNISVVCKLLTYCALLSITGCASFGPGADFPGLVTRGGEVAETETYSDLVSLPEPSGKIVAAVYSFSDETGQYKPAPSNNLSTAVSQGAEAMLVKALVDSQWFLPVERRNLNNLLTERNITQTSLVSQGDGIAGLPPVSPASLIIDGSVIAYDFNVRTGGAGARLLGIGSSQQYREDIVTVNLRAINIRNGLIVNTVNSSKRIFSRQLNNGIFSFVDVDKILELEAGYSYNEPVQLALNEAVESGLISLIADGILKTTWTLKDPTEIRSPVFERFVSETQADVFLNKLAQTKIDQASMKKTVASPDARPGVPTTESSPARSNKPPAGRPETESSANRPDVHATQSAQRTTRGLASEVRSSEVLAKEAQTQKAQSSDEQSSEIRNSETRPGATVKDSPPASDDDPQGAAKQKSPNTDKKKQQLEPVKTTQSKTRIENVVTEEPLEDSANHLTPSSVIDTSAFKETNTADLVGRATETEVFFEEQVYLREVDSN